MPESFVNLLFLNIACNYCEEIADLVNLKNI